MLRQGESGFSSRKLSRPARPGQHKTRLTRRASTAQCKLQGEADHNTPGDAMSNADNSFSAFGKLVPGFDFLQNLSKQAAGSAAQSIPQLPNLGNWVAPTLNVEELDKRIQELKAVQFWLDQNAMALKATIQALEVQKMTLATLKGMNFNMGDVANAFKLKVAASEPDKAKPFSGQEISPSALQASQASAEHSAETALSLIHI